MKSSSESQYFIGLMSGTSTDAIDGVLAQFTEHERPKTVALHHIDMPPSLRRIFLALNHAGQNEIETAQIASIQLAQCYSQCCQELLQKAGMRASQITAIGAHGQTVRHRPDLGFTVQLNAPALLAELTGIDIVADFRSRDIAAGGQGAPFAPLFHHALFSSTKNRVILNLGGMANITLLRPDHPLIGFDTGPANVLMDLWAEQHLGKPYDKNGEWGASGKVNTSLLTHCLQAPYFSLPAPKSTGRDLFNASWLAPYLQAYPTKAQDVMATLRALTAHSIAQAIQRYCTTIEEIIVCGGGVNNQALLQELQQLCPCPVVPIDHYGIDSQAVEALAFAWLARAFITKQTLDFPTLTGAKKSTIAGALYPR